MKKCNICHSIVFSGSEISSEPLFLFPYPFKKILFHP